MALGSGETLTQAVEYVGVHTRGYAREAFVKAAMRLRCGASTEEAMAGLSRELDAPGVGLLTTALVIAQRTGSPLRGLFQSSAQLVERQGEYERMLAVKTAQVRLSVRIVCLLPLVLVCLLSLISVDFQHGVATLPGMVSLLVAAGMDGCALLIIRHLMRGVL
jgi:tight adherence protein B